MGILYRRILKIRSIFSDRYFLKFPLKGIFRQQVLLKTVSLPCYLHRYCILFVIICCRILKIESKKSPYTLQFLLFIESSMIKGDYEMSKNVSMDPGHLHLTIVIALLTYLFHMLFSLKRYTFN